jgi:hypothetical protein
MRMLVEISLGDLERLPVDVLDELAARDILRELGGRPVLIAEVIEAVSD